MAATITIHVGTGTGASTWSGSVTGIDLISADNAINSLANRVNYPVSVCSNSYEKWISACVTATPTNKVENFLLWNNGVAVQTSTSLFVGSCAMGTGATPTANNSSVATTSWDTCSSAAKFVWDSASYAGAGSKTSYAVFQLRVLTAATAGNWTQQQINYSYDES